MVTEMSSMRNYERSEKTQVRKHRRPRLAHCKLGLCDACQCQVTDERKLGMPRPTNLNCGDASRDTKLLDETPRRGYQGLGKDAVADTASPPKLRRR